jgi:hypothetical protein
MKAVTALLMVFVCCPAGPAQTLPEMKLPAGVAVYQPQNLTPEKCQSVANSVHSLMNNMVSVYWDGVAHAFLINNGKPEDRDAAIALLKHFDVPDPRMDLTVSLIRASFSAAAPQGTPVPADLKAAIDEMKGAFNYERYSLWDAIVLHLQGKSGETREIIPADAGGAPYIYTVTYLTGSVQPGSKTVNLASLTCSIKMPQGPDIESHITTSDVTIHEGQKLVIGKIRLMAKEDLFLVLTTKVY